MATTVSPPPDTGRSRYGRLLRTPGAWTFLVPGFAARLPFAMLTLAIVLLVRDTTGSYGSAGAVAAATGISMALFAPLGGRLADRFGQSAVLVPGVLLHATAIALLTSLALLGAPLWALFAAAVPAGASVPQVSPMVRSRWAAVLGTGTVEDGAGAREDGAGARAGHPERSPLLATAAAFESVTDEFTFVVGPVLATALCTGIHPAAGLLAEGALTLVGGLLFAAQRGTQPPVARAAEGARAGAHPNGTGRDASGRDGVPRDELPRGELTRDDGGAQAGPAAGAGSGATGRPSPESRAREKRASALSAPGVRVLAVLFLGIGSVFGGMQVSLTAFTQEIGRPELNGALYGVFAGGNMLAAAVFGAVAWRRPAQWRLLVAYGVLALAASPLWAADSPGTLGALGLIVGLCVAPAMITGFTLVESLAPARARTEAFTWLAGAIALGQALAVTASGQLADGFGASAGFTVPLAGTGLALLIALALRKRLVPGRAARPATGGVDHRRTAAVD
ncbi:MFS transporter [Streptomyces zingiberis]|uniref:MFS transporter n=1 Tax=Streptomyces zingiberis TaxID=2053010 RepID=A0ABX1BWJ6_9ACTN|nr:MFS transporter [Streptomyces zingiberis]NJP99816.1 MFS transporter [Streptomyces zingiberis]